MKFFSVWFGVTVICLLLCVNYMAMHQVRHAHEYRHTDIEVDNILLMPLESFLLPHTAINPQTIAGSKQALRTVILASMNCNTIRANRVALVNISIVPTMCRYGADYNEIIKRLPMKFQKLNFLICDGDCRAFPLGALVVTKTRPLLSSNPKTSTVLPVGLDRHIGPVVEAVADSISFENKFPIALWRGATTSFCWHQNHLYYDTSCSRWYLVQKWSLFNDSRIDVGLTDIIQLAMIIGKKSFEPFQKPRMSLKEMLKYRYLISVEGNDVATNLKWALSSNSVVLMPKPTKESFILEGSLVPWKHYVPLLNDTSDLLEKIIYCENNLPTCKYIAMQSKRWVQNVENVSQVYDLGARIMARHFEMLFPTVYT